MTAHVLFPKIDDVPATLSSFFLTDYLRGTLGFTGLIITDDMSMDAIDTTFTAGEASLLSLEAGADMVLFAAEPKMLEEALPIVKAGISNTSYTRAVQHNDAIRAKLMTY
jgi:beta-N-acetylhexosaminidase